MGLFDFLKTKNTRTWAISGSYIDSNVGETELKELIHAAIVVLEFNQSAGREEVIEKINKRCNDEALAMALYRFIPIAYCRLFIPQANYSDEYIALTSEGDQQHYSFSRDTVYQLIFSICKVAIRFAGGQEGILSILKHCSEFSAINSALNNGADLKDLICGPVYFT